MLTIGARRNRHKACCLRGAEFRVAHPSFFEGISVWWFKVVLETPGVGLTSIPEFGTSLTSVAWSIGAGLAQPILDMPRLKSEIRAQGARADQAVIAYEKAVQTAYAESEDALVQLSSDEARVKLLTAGEAEARRAYDASRIRYGAGIDDLTAVLTAERTWQSARAALTSAQVAALTSSVTAFKALGGGWDPAAPGEERASR